MRINRRFIAAIILTLLTPLIDSNAWLFALQNKAGNKPAQAETKTATDQNAELNQQIRELAKEIRALHDSQRKVIDAMLLQIEQARVDKLEGKLAAVENQALNLAAQEAQLEARLKNIENELVVRNIVNRNEGESAVRAELTFQLEHVRAERERVEAEEQHLRQQVDTINDRLERVRNRLEPEEEKEDPTQKDK
jgi:hypothetical protein